MTPERYEQLGELFARACSLAPYEQASLIADVRSRDPVLADELHSLLVNDGVRDDVFACSDQDSRLTIAGLLYETETGLRQSAPPAAIDSRIGSLVAGRYRLDELLGAGAAGQVYRARDCETGTDVAVKLMRPELIGDPRQVQRFRREFRAISRIDHPGCLAVLGEGLHEEQRYIVMEYVPGGNLERLRQAPDRVLFPVLVHLAVALDCVHGRRIIHRDLKPANILLAPGDPPVPKLADFGIVRLIDDIDTRLTDSGVILGTLDYMAPEACDRELYDGDIDPRCDLYSLGCIIFELWSGRVPFVGSPYQRLIARLRDEAPPLRAFAGHAPARLDDLVARLLERDPARRPQRASDVARELAAIWASLDSGSETCSIAVSLPEPAAGGFLYRPGLVGRDAEIADITARVASAATAPRARLVAVCGQGGMGKSALIAEVAKNLSRKGMRPVVVRSTGSEHTPFAPFPAVLAALAETLTGPPGPAPAAQADDDATGAMAQLELSPAAAAVARREIASQVAGRLQAMNQDVVLVLEDLHQAENNALELLLDLLAQLDRATPHRPVVIATMRPAGQTNLEALAQHDERVEFVALAPLADQAVRQVIAAMLAIAESAVPDALLAHLSSRCAGNPLLVQSAVRALVDREVLRLRGSGWRLEGDQLAIAVENAVGDVLRQRLGAASARTRSILSVAAVCGPIFDVDLLCRVADVDEDTVLDALDEAIRASLVQTIAGRSGREHYRFEHERLAEVLHADMSDDVRSRYHDAVGATFVQRGTASPAVLAFHFASGSDGQRAFHYARRAALAAFRARDYQAAHFHYRAALDRVDSLAEDERKHARQEILEFLADALLLAGQARDSIDCLRQLTAGTGSLTARARWLRKLGVALSCTDRVADGLATMERALALLGDVMPRRRLRMYGRIVWEISRTLVAWAWRRGSVHDPVSEERALLHLELCFLHRWIDTERMGAHASAFMRLAYRIGKSAYLMQAHTASGLAFSLVGLPGLAARSNDKACQLARQTGDMHALSRAEVVRAGMEALIGHNQQATLERLDQGIAIADTIGDRFLLLFGLDVRAWVGVYRGRWPEVARDIRRAARLAAEVDIPWLCHDVECLRGMVELFQGNTGSATEIARRMLASELRLALPVVESLANEILGMEALLGGQFRDAVGYLHRARAHNAAHHLSTWSFMSKFAHTEALLCLADEQGQDAVPDLAGGLRRKIKRGRRFSRLPQYRGYDLWMRGIYQARRGDDGAARGLFTRARAERCEASTSSFMDLWFEARIAFELRRLGDPRESVAAGLDEVDATYASLDLGGMRAWLVRMRELYRA